MQLNRMSQMITITFSCSITSLAQNMKPSQGINHYKQLTFLDIITCMWYVWEKDMTPATDLRNLTAHKPEIFRAKLVGLGCPQWSKSCVIKYSRQPFVLESFWAQPFASCGRGMTCTMHLYRIKKHQPYILDGPQNSQTIATCHSYSSSWMSGHHIWPFELVQI